MDLAMSANGSDGECYTSGALKGDVCTRVALELRSLRGLQGLMRVCDGWTQAVNHRCTAEPSLGAYLLPTE